MNPVSTNRVKSILRLILFVAVIAILAVALTFAYKQLNGLDGQVQVARPGLNTNVSAQTSGAASLNPIERLLLEVQVNSQRAKLNERPSDDASTVTFEVQQGESATSIGSRLEKVGLVVDGGLFRTYVRLNGLENGLEAGKFTLRRNMTIPEVADALTHAYAEEIALTIPEGWRNDQIADLLNSHPEYKISGDAFRKALDEASKNKAGSFDFLADRPSGASLEGYLFPDTYRVPKDATADWLVQAMLKNFGQKVTPQMRGQFKAQNLTVFQAVTLASIVEREARVASERPIIASVYLNRLKQSMALDADPTIQYAIGWDADAKTYWRPLSLDDLKINSPYNTYINAGLPPGPIANPGLSALEGVAQPASTTYLYFRAKCDGSGEHNFAETLDQQAANACQ